MSSWRKPCSSFADIKTDMILRDEEMKMKNTEEYKKEFSFMKNDFERKYMNEATSFEKEIKNLLSTSHTEEPSRDLNKSWRGESNVKQTRKPYKERKALRMEKEYRTLWSGLSLSSKTPEVNNNQGHTPTADPAFPPASNTVGERPYIVPPLIGVFDCNTNQFSNLSWQSLEMINLTNLLKLKSKLKFFRMDICQEQIYCSLYNNGIMRVPSDVYQSIIYCNEKYAKYLLLQESRGSGLHRSSHLVGVANVFEVVKPSDGNEVVKPSDGNEKSHGDNEVVKQSSDNEVVLKFLCLSRSGIDLKNCNSNNQLNVKNVLERCIQTLNDKAAEPYIPNIFPWDGVVPTIDDTLNQNATVFKYTELKQHEPQSSKNTEPEISDNHNVEPETHGGKTVAHVEPGAPGGKTVAHVEPETHGGKTVEHVEPGAPGGKTVAHVEPETHGGKTVAHVEPGAPGGKPVAHVEPETHGGKTVEHEGKNGVHDEYNRKNKTEEALLSENQSKITKLFDTPIKFNVKQNISKNQLNRNFTKLSVFKKPVKTNQSNSSKHSNYPLQYTNQSCDVLQSKDSKCDNTVPSKNVNKTQCTNQSCSVSQSKDSDQCDNTMPLKIANKTTSKVTNSSNMSSALISLRNTDNSLNTAPWQTIEYNNLENVSDWINSKYFICDQSLSNICKSFSNGGKLKLNSFMIDQLGDVVKSTVYLIIRKCSSASGSNITKPVIGVAKVLDKRERDVDVCYLCLSRPRYVSSPWSDEAEFTNGQLICKEDIRILLDEYRMSLRHQKIKPIFQNIYPWSGNISLALSKNNSNAIKMSKTEKSKKGSDGGNVGGTSHINATKIVSDSSQAEVNRIGFPITHHHNNEEKVDTSNGRTTDVHNANRNQTNSSHQSNSAQMNKKNTIQSQRKYDSKLWQENKHENRFPNKSENQANENVGLGVPTHGNKFNLDFQNNNVNCACQSQFRKRFAQIPLRGLLISGTKNVTADSWQMIERKNLEYINTTTGDKEFFLCDTTIKSVRQSLKSSLLAISKKNMENVASANRGRTYFILRTVLADKQSVIGIASIVLATGVTKDPNNTDGYLAQILYFSLSIPALKESSLSGSMFYDGMELYPHVSNNLLQQYMLALKQKKVKPLLDTFPWRRFLHSSCSCNSTNRSLSCSSNASSVPSSPHGNASSVPSSPHGDDDVFEPEKSVNRGTLVDDNIPDTNLLTYLNSDKTCSMSFTQIESEISLQSVRTSPAFHQLFAPLPLEPVSKLSLSKEVVETNIKKYHADFLKQVTLNKGHSGHVNIWKPTGVHSENRSIGKGRGRGRGMLLYEQVAQFGGGHQWSNKY